MRGRLIISEPEAFCLDGFSRDFSILDYKINIYTDLSEKYEDLIKNADFEEDFENTFSVMDDDEEIEFYEECKKNQTELLKNCEYVTFMFPIEEACKYIEENPILKDKKLLYQVGYDLNFEIISLIEKNFKDTSSIYFDVIGNSEFISFEQYKQTVKTIYNIIDEVNSYDFSPLEKIMYVYDIVREKVYKEVDDGENKMISRNLSSSLLGDKIVCVGYSRIFDSILDQLNIDSREILLHYPNGKGHARNNVYIKDEKYNIDGIYYFDTTFDSRKNNEDTRYLFSYKYFAKTKDEIDSLTKKDLKEDNFHKFPSSLFEDLIDEVYDKELYELSDEICNSANYMSHRLLGKKILDKKFIRIAPPSLIMTKEEIIDKVEDLMVKFDTPIKAEVFIEALFNVRKEQYKKDPDKYPFDINTFFRAILISEWNFNDVLDSAFLNEAYKARGESFYINNKNNLLLKYDEKTNLEKRIEEAKKQKVLELNK